MADLPDRSREQWEPVPDFEGLYEVSTHGRIRRVGRAARHGNGRGGGARIGRVLRQHRVRNGYLAAQLWKDGRPTMLFVHRLVAAAFLGPCPDGLEVNHCDGIKTSNHVENLEYMTRSENNRHAYRTGLRKVTIDQMVRKRRQPRVMVTCECGCATEIETPDPKGRKRRYVSGHNMRRVQ